MSDNKLFKAKTINILFTCVGRRVSLVNSFRKAARILDRKSCIIGTDKNYLSPAFHICDKSFIVDKISSPKYLRQILDIVKKNRVHLLVPTVDLDLKILARNKHRFEKINCTVLISSADVIDICQDKRKTFKFLTKNALTCPYTISLASALRKKDLVFPCFLKPWDGYAGRGNAIVNNRKELSVIGKRIPNCIVQKYIKGIEYTCDVFVDFDLKVRTAVPRKRIEVRSGEVSKAQIVKDKKIMLHAAKAVEKLKAGPGVITVQLIVNGNGSVSIIEINPRFGGGVPLSIKAGADSPKWLLQMLTGKEPKIGFDAFKDGLTMLRYDGEVWLESGQCPGK